ncbi:MAG TPA: DnaJ domain-containing protein, partial [Candidatus Saccharimonadales bacterium]|nr:DnaJ domain-containing protein [Candidatus Saccharimonadales bacterium]
TAMVKRDPHLVLGVGASASATEIKAAWRRLARENHPDLTGDDPAASRAATRRMAEINDAYAALTRESGRGRGRGADDKADFGDGVTTRRGGPPKPRPSRPVTGRVDTTGTFRPRNQTTVGGGRGAAATRVGASAARATILTGQPPLRGERVHGEPPRASTPTGPLERDRLRHFRRPPPPSLEAAREHVIEFGKFHGHSLGDIAAFEPSYIDWVASTVTRDPELVAAARVIQSDLDTRGIARRSHPTPVRPGRTA